MDISNTTGPKGKSQAENKGTWSRVERKPTTSPSDANIRDLSRERPAFDETELKTKKNAELPLHMAVPHLLLH